MIEFQFHCVLCASIAAVAGCASPPSGGSADSATMVRATVADLESVVADLSLPPKTWPQEIADERLAEYREQRSADFQRASLLATSLLSSARELARSTRQVTISEAERSTVQAQARSLAVQARQLQAAACREDFRGVRSAVRAIQTSWTCQESAVASTLCLCCP